MLSKAGTKPIKRKVKQKRQPRKMPDSFLQGDPPRKVGRPTKYTPDMCDTVRECGKEGKTLVGMAEVIGISMETMGVWRRENAKFSEAIKDAQISAQALWEEKGMSATFGEVPGFSATSYIFQMKNRFSADWRDKTEVDNNFSVTIRKEDSGL